MSPTQTPTEADQGTADTGMPNTGMHVELSDAQRQARREFRAFVDAEIVPHAAAWDRAGRVPMEFIDRLRERHWLGSPLPEEAGGLGMEPITYGLLTEEMGRGCSSVRSLLTVHDMTTRAVHRWGSAALKEAILEPLARGEKLGALALSEPNVGSDAAQAETQARRDGDHFVLDGVKKWTTFGQLADYYLALAQCDGKPTAFLVPADAPGLRREAMEPPMGTRASLLAEIHLEGCRIPAENLLARVGFGFSHVISTALDHGRYSVAWGSVGIAQGCLEACRNYTRSRRQGGKLLQEHQLVQRKLTELLVNTRAARLLCCRAGHLRRSGDPSASTETMIAKYFASRTATAAAHDAVQLHGANGMTDDYPVGRYLRDAQVTEIIEGSTHIQQISIPWMPLPEL
ncbi:MAG: acyl-CoA dehydrogenase family protein [Acidobacteriota bacterium]|nr:acyl-CoA dehydrogenase family protein [Acidobacteriota bacterium]